MRLIKTISALFLIPAMLFVLFSCVGDGEESREVSRESIESEQTDISESNSESSAEESVYTPELKDLDDREIRFLVAGSGYSYYESFEIYAGETANETINDAVYERNQIIQDKYNCIITADKSNNVANDMRTYVSADLDEYDVYMPMINDAVRLVGEGLMLDLKELTGLKLDKPWWDQKA